MAREYLCQPLFTVWAPVGSQIFSTVADVFSLGLFTVVALSTFM